MKFEKAVMKTSELRNMGFTKAYLLALAHREGQKYAFRENPRGDLLWDTERLKKEIEKDLVR